MIANRLSSLILASVIALMWLFLASQIVLAHVGIESMESPNSISHDSAFVAHLMPPMQGAVPSVVISSSAGKPIDFWTQNGNTSNGAVPSSIPHLVLHEGGLLTSQMSRTVTVTVSGVEVNAGDVVTVEIAIKTQHRDPDLGGDVVHPAAPRITVWQETQTRTVPIGQPSPQVFDIVFPHEFTESIQYNGVMTDTPTDYFAVEVNLNGAPLRQYTPDYKFLLENQWTQPLLGVQEDSPNAGPHELILYYSDMVPFGLNSTNPATWLRRADVPAYITNSLALSMSQVFHEETDDWGMDAWHDDWLSPRGEKRLAHGAMRLPKSGLHG